MDRLSVLKDSTLGHILSFLDAQEAGRTAVLSSRWCNIFQHVDTIMMEEKTILDSDPGGNGDHVVNNTEESMANCDSDGNLTLSMADWDSDGNRTVSMPDWDDDGNRTVSMADWASEGNLDSDPGGNVDRTKPRMDFSTLVTWAFLARIPVTGKVLPLRALRVSLQSYKHHQRINVDSWLTHVLSHAAPSLEVSLFLSYVPDCKRMYNQCGPSVQQALEAMHVDENMEDGSTSSSSSAKIVLPPPIYSVPRKLLRCHVLRTLRLGTVMLCTPADVSLPALDTLHLTQVPDSEEDVQKLILACPNLLDLTLEGCGMVSTLSLLSNTCIRNLAFRCCSGLSVVYVSNIHTFQYRGNVPVSCVFAAQDGAFQHITTCTIDVCGGCLPEEDMTKDDSDRIRSFASLFATTRRLKLCSPKMGSAFQELPTFFALQHLWLSGRVMNATVSAVISVLEQTPNLGVLTISFEVVARQALHRHEDTYDSLDHMPIPICLRSRVSTINLLNIQGDKAQAALIKYLLRNTQTLKILYCLFEALNQEVMEEEMRRWLVSKRVAKEFQPPWFWERMEGEEEAHYIFRQKEVTKVFEHGW